MRKHDNTIRLVINTAVFDFLARKHTVDPGAINPKEVLRVANVRGTRMEVMCNKGSILVENFETGILCRMVRRYNTLKDALYMGTANPSKMKKPCVAQVEESPIAP